MKQAPARILAALLVISIAVPAVAQVTEDDVQKAQAEIDRIVAKAQDLNDRMEAARGRQYALEAEIDSLHASIAHAQIQLEDVKARLEEVAVEMYMASASGASMAALLGSGGNDYQTSMEYLRRISGSDENLADQIQSYRNQLDRQTERLAAASEEQAELVGDLEEMSIQLQEDLDRAFTLHQDLAAKRQAQEEARLRRLEEERLRRAEEERLRLEALAQATTTTPAQTSQAPATTQPSAPATTSAPPTTAAPTTPSTSPATTVPGPTTTTQPGTPPPPPPPPPSGGSCPVAGPNVFTDTWGAPRSGGRSHQGVDMRAARGVPTAAIFSGVIFQVTPIDIGLGGISVWLQASNGDRFYYAHLDSLGPISVGQSVPQGHVVGYVGSTGNADDSWPHLHFEWHRFNPATGTRTPVNPYPLVRPLC